MNAKLMSLSALTTFMLAMAGAHAAPPEANLKVTGKLVVPVCAVAADNNGVYDIGRQPATLIKPNANTTLPSMTKTWTVTCDAETYLNFTHSDNREDSTSVVARPNFGLGNVNGAGKLGFYTVDVKNPTVDGVTTRVFSTMNNTITSTDVVPYLSVHKENRHGWAANSSIAQQSGKIFAADFVVTPTLASSAVMNGPITEDTDIDGSLTLNFAFGI